MSKISKISKMPIVAVLIIIFTCLTGCKGIETDRPVTQVGYYLDTVVSITLYGDSELCNTHISDCMALIGEYDRRFSRSRYSDSEIALLNSGLSNTVTKETAELIELALDYCELSGGAFDISIAPVSMLWDFTSGKGSVPASDSISAAVELVDYNDITVFGTEVRFNKPDMAIDLGGIAKGYIADRIKEYLVSNGVKNAIIDIGGNLVVIGGRPDGENFNVGVQNPNGNRDEYACILSIQSASVVTSGTYERAFEEDGVWYHHILDAHTGYPVETDIVSATIVSEASVDGDALSTICVLLGSERAKDLLSGMEDIYAVFILDDESIVYVNGAEKLVVNK